MVGAPLLFPRAPGLPSRLTPLELRLAALAEGGDAFLGVGGVGGEAAGKGFKDDTVVAAGGDGGVD